MIARSHGPHLHTARHGALLTITLDRTAKANALSAGMMFGLAEAVRAAGPGDLLVLRSASAGVFCAGADIAEFVAGPEQLARQEQGLLALIAALAETDAPVLAVARGRASGAGLILLTLADIVLTGEDLQLSAPELAFGMFPIVVEAVLQSRLWPALASRICTGVAPVGAAEALALGLVTEILPEAGFEAEAEQRLEYYKARLPALRALRGSRKAGAATAAMLQQLETAMPMMTANFGAPGVRDRIRAYLSALRERPRPG